MNRKIITIGLIILLLAIVTKLIYRGFKSIKIDDFKPAAVIFVVDSSASNQSALPEQKKYLKQLCSLLDPEDKIKILKVSQDSYLIYEGTPHNNSGITKAMEAFTQYNPDEIGTAYGQALKKAFSHALTMKKEGYTPAVVIIGDLENEGAVEKQINWDTLPQNVKSVKDYAPDISMMFVFAHPSKLDLVKEKLNPVLGEQKLVVSPSQNVDRASREFLKAIGR